MERPGALGNQESYPPRHAAEAVAERAASENNPLHYRDAFAASLKAMRLLGEESGAWRQMVARATEEFEGDEGI